jgi:heme-degrading monooxygenase HmoA
MTDDRFASTPAPHYYAVIFTSTRTPGDHGYEAAARRMFELAGGQPGFLGVESVRGADGFGITVSYWTDPAAIQAWKEHAEHVLVQERGRREWYEHYELRVARVERSYAGPAAALHAAAWDVAGA